MKQWNPLRIASVSLMILGSVGPGCGTQAEQSAGSPIAAPDSRAHFKATLELLTQEAPKVEKLIQENQAQLKKYQATYPTANGTPPGVTPFYAEFYEVESHVPGKNGRRATHVFERKPVITAEQLDSYQLTFIGFESRNLNKSFRNELAQGYWSDSDLIEAVRNKLKLFDDARESVTGAWQQNDVAMAEKEVWSRSLEGQLSAQDERVAQLHQALLNINMKERAFVMTLADLLRDAREARDAQAVAPKKIEDEDFSQSKRLLRDLGDQIIRSKQTRESNLIGLPPASVEPFPVQLIGGLSGDIQIDKKTDAELYQDILINHTAFERTRKKVKEDFEQANPGGPKPAMDSRLEATLLVLDQLEYEFITNLKGKTPAANAETQALPSR